MTIAQSKKLQTPFILITATISEEYSVYVIKMGAIDYILKDSLNRLPVAVGNALEKIRLEKEKQSFKDQLEANERRFRGIIKHGTDGIVILSPAGFPTYVSPSINYILGYSERRSIADKHAGYCASRRSEKDGRKIAILCFTAGCSPAKNRKPRKA
jgi:PAS domain-containing protein